MIQSIEPQVVDGQNKKSEIVYMTLFQGAPDYIKKTRLFTVLISLKQEDGSHLGIRENKAIFKEKTFMNLFGHLTMKEFSEQGDELMIAHIAFINTYNWTGLESQDKVRFWDLKASDMKKVEAPK